MTGAVVVRCEPGDEDHGPAVADFSRDEYRCQTCGRTLTMAELTRLLAAGPPGPVVMT